VYVPGLIAAAVQVLLVGSAPLAPSATQVRAAFLHAWQGYRRYAWGHDDLDPLSRKPHDWYGVPLLMTPVDAYDTMLLMGLTDEAADAKRLILERLSFDQDVSVQVFEVTIRLLGGLLSAYDQMVKNLTAAQLQEAAKKYFDMSNYARFVLLPETKTTP